MKLRRESYVKIMTVTAYCTCLSMHNKHSTVVSQAVVSHFAMNMPNACSGYVFNAVNLRRLVHSSCLRARLWLNHDLEVIFDGHPHDVRTIWSLKHGFLLLHKLDPSSKPHLVLSFSLSCHGQLVSWCFKPSQPQRIISGLRETFTKRYIVETTKKAEKDQKNRLRKRRVVGMIFRMKYS